MAARTGGLRVLKRLNLIVKLITAVRVMRFATDRTGTHFLVIGIRKMDGVILWA